MLLRNHGSHEHYQNDLLRLICTWSLLYIIFVQIYIFHIFYIFRSFYIFYIFSNLIQFPTGCQIFTFFTFFYPTHDRLEKMSKPRIHAQNIYLYMPLRYSYTIHIKIYKYIYTYIYIFYNFLFFTHKQTSEKCKECNFVRKVFLHFFRLARFWS